MDRPLSVSASPQMKYDKKEADMVANGQHIISRVPMDVWLHTFSGLGIKDIVSFSGTCKYLKLRMSSPAVWQRVFQRNFKKLFPCEVPGAFPGHVAEVDYLLACKNRYEVAKSVDVCTKTVPKSCELVNAPHVFTYKNTIGIQNEKGIEFFYKDTMKPAGSYKYDELIPFGVKFLQKDDKIYVTRIMDRGRVDAIDMNSFKVTAFHGLNNNYAEARCQINSQPFVSNGYLFASAQHKLKMWNLETRKLEQEFDLSHDDHVCAVEYAGINDKPHHVPCVKIITIDSHNNIHKTKITLIDKKSTKSLLSHLDTIPYIFDNQFFMSGNFVAIKFGSLWYAFLGDERIHENKKIVGLELCGEYLTTLNSEGQVEVLNIENNTVENEFSLPYAVTKASLKSLGLGVLSIAVLGFMQVGSKDLEVDRNNFTIWNQFTGECMSDNGHLRDLFQSKVLRAIGTHIYGVTENKKEKTQTITLADLIPRTTQTPSLSHSTATESSGSIFSRAKKAAKKILPI